MFPVAWSAVRPSVCPDVALSPAQVRMRGAFDSLRGASDPLTPETEWQDYASLAQGQNKYVLNVFWFEDTATAKKA